MKKTFFGLLMAALCFMTGSSAFAVTVTLIDTVESVTRNGVPEGLSTVDIGGQEVLAMCIDYDTHISGYGQTAVADVNRYFDIQFGAGKFSGLTNALTRYNQAFWLFSQVSVNPNRNADLQEAIWKIFGASPVMSANGNNWYALATSGPYDTFDWLDIGLVITPNPSDSFQEMFVSSFDVSPPPSAVPLPSAAQLFGLGFAGLAGGVVRKKK